MKKDIRTDEQIELVEGKFSIQNFEQSKEYLASVLPLYEVKEINEDTYALAKNNRAVLNKVAKALNDNRIKYQKEYLEPFNVGKQQYDELIEMIKNSVLVLDSGIKKIEDEQKVAIKKVIVSYFTSKNIYPISYEQIEDEKWYNKSAKIEDTEKAIDEKLENMAKDIRLIVSDYKKKAERAIALRHYFETLDYVQAKGLTVKEIEMNDRVSTFEENYIK